YCLHISESVSVFPLKTHTHTHPGDLLGLLHVSALLLQSAAHTPDPLQQLLDTPTQVLLQRPRLEHLLLPTVNLGVNQGSMWGQGSVCVGVIVCVWGSVCVCMCCRVGV